MVLAAPLDTVLTPPANADDRLVLTQLLLACVDLLVLDDLWTETIENGDAAATKVGHAMTTRLAYVQEHSSLLAAYLDQLGPQFDAVWSHIFTGSGFDLAGLELAPPQAAPLSAQFGSPQWKEALAEEAETIAAKIHALEMGFQDGPRIGDLTFHIRRWLGVACLAAAIALGAPAISLAPGPVAQVAQQEAGVIGQLAIVVFTVALSRDRPRPPAPR